MHAYQAIETGKAAGWPSSHPDATILRTFQTSLAWFTSSISAIIVEASATTSNLDRLEECLAMAHALCLREQFETTLALDDLLWELWTKLGGHRSKVRDLKNRASVLKNIQKYRSIAIAYVAGTMQTLSAIDVELSELRDRLSAPALEANHIPLEVQLASIESSVRRLKEGQYGGAGRQALGIRD